MAIVQDDVTILNFDSTYESQTFLKRENYEWIELGDIPSTSRFCSEEALTVIQERLENRHNKGVTFIGNGNYHYVSLLLLREIKSPFTLVLFDNHTDLLESSFVPLLSCGSWVLHALENVPTLEKVVMVGVNPNFQQQIPPHLRSKISIIPHSHFLFQNKAKLYTHIQSLVPTRDVYISIDKDVLDESVAKTNWDHGCMLLSSLLSTLHSINEKKSIVGIDICGEYPVQSFFDKKGRIANETNSKANKAILDTIMHLSNLGKISKHNKLLQG